MRLASRRVMEALKRWRDPSTIDLWVLCYCATKTDALDDASATLQSKVIRALQLAGYTYANARHIADKVNR